MEPVIAKNTTSLTCNADLNFANPYARPSAKTIGPSSHKKGKADKKQEGEAKSSTQIPINGTAIDMHTLAKHTSRTTTEDPPIDLKSRWENYHFHSPRQTELAAKCDRMDYMN